MVAEGGRRGVCRGGAGERGTGKQKINNTHICLNDNTEVANCRKKGNHDKNKPITHTQLHNIHNKNNYKHHVLDTGNSKNNCNGLQHKQMQNSKQL